MKITYHAAQRFLERVFQMKTFTKEHIKNAKKLLEKEISTIKTHRKHFILPTFPNFLGVRVDNTLVTIIPK